MSQEAILCVLAAQPQRAFSIRELASLTGVSFGATATSLMQMAKFQEVQRTLVNVVKPRANYVEWHYRYRE